MMSGRYGVRSLLQLLGCIGLLLLFSPEYLVAAERTGGGDPDLDAIRVDISRLGAQLRKLERQRLDSAGRLAEIELELELRERQLAEARRRKANATAALHDARARVEILRTGIAQLRQRLKESVRGLYRLGRYGYLRLFLDIRSRSMLLPGIRTLRYLVRKDLEDVAALNRAFEDLSVELEDLAIQRADLEAWERREAERSHELTLARRRHSGSLARVESEMGSANRRRLELQTMERRLVSLLEYLAEQVESPLEDRRIQDFRGVLEWPAPGRVERGFGPQMDPRYGTRVPHNGLDIRTEPGSRVHTIYPGEVAFAEPFSGYGPTVIVFHSGQVFSLYAGLSDLKVRRGDVLSSQEVLGLSSGTFYFEVRVQNRPEDPLLWLR